MQAVRDGVQQQLSSITIRLMMALPAVALMTASLGAWTRLADAGLGCPDWPGCYGFVFLPEGQQEIALAESRYPGTPYEAGKALLEVAHRYIAALTGLLILVVTAMLWLNRSDRRLRTIATAAALAVCVQGLFGYLTVSLKLWPQIVSAHLFGGLLVLSLTWMMVLRAIIRPDRPAALAVPFRAALGALFFQIALGVWVSSNYAALACTDFPLCQGQLLPPLDFAAGFDLTNPPGPNYLHGQLGNEARTAIHIGHRLGALIAACALIWLGLRALRQGLVQRGAGLLVLLCLQLLLGILNVVLTLPIAVAVAHHLVAALLLLMVLSLWPEKADSA